MQTVQPELFRTLQPLAALSPESTLQLERFCTVRGVGRGLDLLNLNELNRHNLYLLKGQMRLVLADQTSEVMVGGTASAAHPIVTGLQKLASAKAITDCTMMCIDSNLLDVLFTWDQLTNKLDVAAFAEEQRTDWRKMSGMLNADNLTSGLFSALPPANIIPLLDRFERILARRGQQIVRQGDAGDYYYVIESGRCSVTRKVGGTEVRIAELKAGDAFGEEALVADTVRNASVDMKSDGALLRLPRQDFVELLREPLMHRLGMAEARAKATQGAVWLDVRFPSEFLQDKLSGAINIPVSEIRSLFQALDRSQEYIVYCQSGRRSSAAGFLLAQAGFRTWVLDGGLWASGSERSGAMHRPSPYNPQNQ